MRVLLALAGLLCGCVMLTRFDPEGQPCDLSAAPEMQCLQNYHCERGRCVAGAFDAGRPDGG